MKYFFFLFVAVLIFSCQKKEKNEITYNLVDKYIDSTNSGEKGKTRIVAEQFQRNDDSGAFVILNFYHKEKIIDYKSQKYKYKWHFDNRYYFETTSPLGIGANLQDFNNDGFKDFTYQSSTAARGGNEVRKLFIYNPVSKKFNYIRNSERYPNLFYNSKLNCIGSIILTGSTTSYFLKIKKDTLYDFAKVDASDSVLVKERNENGEYQIIQKRKLNKNEDELSTFSNFKPLEK
ncbi:XAC2610-related protein [Epilithonimonas sp.]|uniref:XAC2610-related protein n=1 Tax=Epilithonimonas sp. TaxID=2894511 RepID=UPI002FDD813B